MSALTSRVITTHCGGKGLKIPNRRSLTQQGVQFTRLDNRKNYYSPRYWYQQAFDLFTEDILVYTHDDLTIHDTNWHRRVMYCFDTDTSVVAVGLGGALGLGVPDLYKKPYKLDDMARQSYWSNQTDAEVHGQQTSGLLNVAVLDAFFMAVRREFLMSLGGWPMFLTHHGLDLWLACEAKRRNKSIVMTGVSCTHHGGGTSIKQIYQDASWLQGGSLDRDHQTPHEFLYDIYRDVLPFDVRTK